MKIGAYIRVSTAHQVDKESIPSQKNMIASYARAMFQTEGKDITYYIDAGFSGKNTKRPRYSELLRDIEAGKINVVIVYKIDRVSRNLLDFAAFIDNLKKYEVKFISLSENFDTSSIMGQAMLKMLMLFAEMERGLTAERVMSISKDIVSRGGHLGAPTAFGYDYDKVSRKYTINEAEAETVKKVFRLAYEGKSTTWISNYLNGNNVKTKRGGVWTSTTVHHILKNPSYKGWYVWNRQKTGRSKAKAESEWITNKGFFDIIVPESEWDAVQEKLKERQHGKNTVRASHTHLLSRIVACGECGRTFRYRLDRPRKDGIPVSIYSCAGRIYGCKNTKYVSDIALAPFCFQLIRNLARLKEARNFVMSSSDVKMVVCSHLGYDLINAGEIFAIFASGNTENSTPYAERIRKESAEASEKAASELAKLQAAAEKLKDFYLDASSEMTREEFQTRRAKIEKEMEAVSKQKEIKLSRTKIDLNLEKEEYAEIKKFMDGNPFSYHGLASSVDHARLAEYLHLTLGEITIEDAAVTSVTLKNGVRFKFQIIK